MTNAPYFFGRGNQNKKQAPGVGYDEALTKRRVMARGVSQAVSKRKVTLAPMPWDPPAEKDDKPRRVRREKAYIAEE
jgi:hypothetical protein